MLSFSLKYRLRDYLLEKPTRLFRTSSHVFDKDDSENRKAAAAQKLNSLLQSLVEDKGSNLCKTETSTKFEISKANPNLKKKMKKMKEEQKVKNLGEKIVEAAVEVAQVVEGEKKENEIKLLQQLLFRDTPLKDEITKAYSTNLSELLVGMKIEKEKEKSGFRSNVEGGMSRADQVRIALDEKKADGRYQGARKKSSRPIEHTNLFASQPLGIFDKKILEDTKEETRMNVWNNCYNRELRLSVTHPPSNIYEQMIIWTERGILWKFPIDNEQGMEEEKEVPFSEHVFLEVHLEGWCPSSGPIRHFMELVCVGLSKNHWYTAEEKKQHILWYKDFFTNKKDLIKELGAGEIVRESDSSPKL